MDRHIDLDSAMIAHLEELGYTVRHKTDSVPGAGEELSGLPILLQRAIIRAAEAGGKYGNAWDCLSQNALAEIIIMKGNRVLAALDNDDTWTAGDSLVDIVNYACKLFHDIHHDEEAN